MGGRLPTYLFTTRNSAMIAAWFVVIEDKLHFDRTCRATGAAGFSPSLYCRTNAPGDVHLAIIRGTPSCRAEISGEYQARSYDEPNGEPAHALVPRCDLRF